MIKIIKGLFYGFLDKFGMIKHMGIRFGPFDPLQLTLSILNALMQKGLVSVDEAKGIIRASLPPEMPDTEKEALLNSMVKPTPPRT
ncbi:MAG TPA: hypothetical protein VJB95_01195 [Candidatus Paceibacterota bacterium]